MVGVVFEIHNLIRADSDELEARLKYIELRELTHTVETKHLVYGC